jgi:hypothetical protein
MTHETFSCSVGPLPPEQYLIDPAHFSKSLVDTWPDATIKRDPPESPVLFRGKISIGQISASYAFSKSQNVLLLEDGEAVTTAKIVLWFLSLMPRDAILFIVDEYGVDEIRLSASMTEQELAEAMRDWGR